MNTSRPILIIGAGLAGLSAAAELNRLGHRPLVLEASDRIGGRLRTDRSAGFPMELGAQVLLGPAILKTPKNTASRRDSCPRDWTRSPASFWKRSPRPASVLPAR
jgi:phytoene dehydrogenase-like protein